MIKVPTFEENLEAFLRGHGLTRPFEGKDVLVFGAHEMCPVGRVNEGGVKLKPAPMELWPNIIPTARLVMEARLHFGRPMAIQSAYRDLEYNRTLKEKSSDNSLHVQFKAMDVRPIGVSIRDLYNFFDAHPLSKYIGLGLYKSFVHVDTRGTKARW
jgi:hypothetical protein